MNAIGSTPLAELLHARRRVLRLSRPDVCRSTGITESALETYERGVKPRVDRAMLLARLYAISFDELADAAGVPSEVSILPWNEVAA